MRVAILLCLLFIRNGEGLDLVQDTEASGYSMQVHQLHSEDGYILIMHRIPYGKDETKTGPVVRQKPPVLLMHGIMGSSADFVNQGPKSKFAFVVADAGFDVWLGNARGNPYSRAHSILDPDNSSADFFNFSWEEVAIYDVRAMVDYILGATSSPQIRYIGDAEGGTWFLILNILKPEYNKKFQMAQLLDPVGYTKYFPSEELKLVADMIEPLYTYAQELGIAEISSLNIQENVTEIRVTGQVALQSIVSYIASLGGYRSMGTSLKQLVHLAQNIRDQSFRSWNYGEKINKQIYGAKSPARYDLSQVTVYTVLYYRKNNIFVHENDVKEMALNIKNAIAIEINGTYSEIDFVDIARTTIE
ncbi:lipase 1-like [Leguminivora glycinivorella]|uniref:lipase 1-like n=1 Tax=Leguminivora glycinivorella TaxID=1035111 RepID=UPI00200F98EB|nr:lipase 1-like [Leguminivora glycinivorella]